MTNPYEISGTERMYAGRKTVNSGRSIGAIERPEEELRSAQLFLRLFNWNIEINLGIGIVIAQKPFVVELKILPLIQRLLGA